MKISGCLATNPTEAHQAAQLGFAVQLLLHTPRATFAMAAMSAWLIPAIRLQQIAFLFDPHSGRPRAYATWAFLTPEVSRALADDPLRLLHLSEWNEGLEPWVMDVVAPFGGAGLLLRTMRRGVLADIPNVRGFGRRQRGRAHQSEDLAIGPVISSAGAERECVDAR